MLRLCVALSDSSAVASGSSESIEWDQELEWEESCVHQADAAGIAVACLVFKDIEGLHHALGMLQKGLGSTVSKAVYLQMAPTPGGWKASRDS